MRRVRRRDVTISLCIAKIGDEVFYLAHGEGLGTTSRGFKTILGIFNNKFLQRGLHSPASADRHGIGHAWSKSSRLAKHISVPFMGEEREDLIRHTRRW
ncbi:MAG: hypothetical protein MZV63_25045 [Marinilabiliales bacterium]|nr:hypothetical protein [Marinilabiliales bacterium]